MNYTRVIERGKGKCLKWPSSLQYMAVCTMRPDVQLQTTKVQVGMRRCVQTLYALLKRACASPHESIHTYTCTCTAGTGAHRLGCTCICRLHCTVHTARSKLDHGARVECRSRSCSAFGSACTRTHGSAPTAYRADIYRWSSSVVYKRELPNSLRNNTFRDTYFIEK